jgi:hypothetical protein
VAQFTIFLFKSKEWMALYSYIIGFLTQRRGETEGYKKMPFTKPENFQFDFSCSGEIPVDSSAILNSKTKNQTEIQ